MKNILVLLFLSFFIASCTSTSENTKLQEEVSVVQEYPVMETYLVNEDFASLLQSIKDTPSNTLPSVKSKFFNDLLSDNFITLCTDKSKPLSERMPKMLDYMDAYKLLIRRYTENSLYHEEQTKMFAHLLYLTKAQNTLV
jgi:hypothetical protein